MKIKNKSNGVEAEVPDSLGELLVNAGSWESLGGEPEKKPVRRRSKKPVEDSSSEG